MKHLFGNIAPPAWPRTTRWALAWLFLASLALPPSAPAEEATLPEIEVFLPTPLLGGTTDAERATMSVYTLEERSESVTRALSERLEEQTPGLHTGDVQNNPFQRDMSFRGYTASPLLGSPQGVAVYQNGVRINEVFGDTVEWDTIPDFAADTIQVVPGANPVFGLNALGATLALRMKDGFNFRGGRIGAQYGSFGRRDIVGEYGLVSDKEDWATYIGARYGDEDGWRDGSPSYLRQGYGSLGRKGERYRLNLDFSYADNDLTGNGPVPIDLMALEGRRAIFTAPDTTRNELFMGSVGGFYEVNNSLGLRARAYYRDRKRPTLNGDEYDGEGCDKGLYEGGPDAEGELVTIGKFLCNDDNEVLAVFNEGDLRAYAEEGITSIDPSDDDVYENNFEQDYEDKYGDEPPEEDDRWGEFAAMNRTNTESKSYGLTLQGEYKSTIGSYENFFIGGFSYDHGETDYVSDTEIGIFADDRSVRGAGRKIAAMVGCETDAANLRVARDGEITCADDDELDRSYVATNTDNETDYWGIYFSDALKLNDSLTLELAGRYNRAEIELKDKSGHEPKLNGTHTFTRFNPAAAMSYRFSEAATVFASYREANRAPTPAELSCADEDDPCRFPNAFVADPPLEQVVNRTIEVGGRGVLRSSADHIISWQGALYGGENEDDIVFVGGKTVGTGFFKNVGKTRRVGADFGISGVDEDGWDWGLAYSFINATFESAFKVDCVNHPKATRDSDGEVTSCNGSDRVSKGNDIPSIPRHLLRGRVGYMLGDNWRFDAGFSYAGEQYYRGDESNLLEELDGYWLANAETSYMLGELMTAFIRVNNIFNHEYDSFGVLGNGGEVFGGEGNAPYDRELGDPYRFVSPGTPLTVLAGVNLRF